MTESQKKAAMSALDATVALVQGRYLEAAQHFVEGAVELVPADVARRLLTEIEVRRANAVAVELENQKFGS